MNRRLAGVLIGLLPFVLTGSVVVAQPRPGVPPASPAPSEFIVLGTASGPNSEAARAQPANALLVQGQVYLVDAGDGAVAQLAKAGLRLPAVRAVFLSHLHFDHTGGMLAVIGLRMQLEVPGTLRVFGPQGTRELVDGLLAASRPAMRAGYGIPGQGWSADIEVVELADGDSVSLTGFDVTVAEHSHLGMPAGDSRSPGSREATGFEWHMYAHHMTPTQVGELAGAAGV
jgi:ribonuclease BN (tRNA processing enzyme)